MRRGWWGLPAGDDSRHRCKGYDLRRRPWTTQTRDCEAQRQITSIFGRGDIGRARAVKEDAIIPSEVPTPDGFRDG